MKPSLKHLALPALLLGLSAAASAAPVFVSGVDADGGWLDVNKANPRNDDVNLCWAAATSNILAYTGWTGGSSLSSNSSIFSNFKYYWNDLGGHALYGAEWWFDGVNQKQGEAGWAQLDRFSHIGFYSKALYGSNAEFSSITGENTLFSYVHGDTALGNVGIALSIGWMNGASREGGHSVTLWGVDTVANLVYITDSDDDSTTLKSYTYDETTLYLTNYAGGNGLMENLFGLDMKEAGDPAPKLPQLPEPSSFALLGLGLVGLGLARRRRPA